MSSTAAKLTYDLPSFVTKYARRADRKLFSWRNNVGRNYSFSSHRKILCFSPAEQQNESRKVEELDLNSAEIMDEFSSDNSPLLAFSQELSQTTLSQSNFPIKKFNVELPPGLSSRVKSAEFIKSSANVSQCPNDEKPEFAVIGRSNVGKSSLINMLVNRKDLAQTSKKPGKTQLINHFLINNNWYLVDLPGYGYAKTAKEKRVEWNDFTKNYFLQRKNLLSVMLLVDATIPPQTVDLTCASWFGENKIPVTIVFTKCDRKKKAKNGGQPPQVNVQAFEEALSEFYDEIPPWVMTSSVSGMGKDDLLLHIAQLRRYWKS